MKEREADLGRIGPVDLHEIALRPIGGGKARARAFVLGVGVGQSLDLVDDPLEDLSVPPRRAGRSWRCGRGCAIAGRRFPRGPWPRLNSLIRRRQRFSMCPRLFRLPVDFLSSNLDCPSRSSVFSLIGLLFRLNGALGQRPGG